MHVQSAMMQRSGVTTESNFGQQPWQQDSCNRRHCIHRHYRSLLAAAAASGAPGAPRPSRAAANTSSTSTSAEALKIAVAPATQLSKEARTPSLAMYCKALRIAAIALRCGTVAGAAAAARLRSSIASASSSSIARASLRAASVSEEPRPSEPARQQVWGCAWSDKIDAARKGQRMQLERGRQCSFECARAAEGTRITRSYDAPVRKTQPLTPSAMSHSNGAGSDATCCFCLGTSEAGSRTSTPFSSFPYWMLRACSMTPPSLITLCTSACSQRGQSRGRGDQSRSTR